MFHYSDGDGVFSGEVAVLKASGMEVDRLKWAEKKLIINP